MTWSKKRIITVAVAIAIIAILAVAWWLGGQGMIGQPPEASTANGGKSPESLLEDRKQLPSPPLEKGEEQGMPAAVARSVLERYGSWSSASDLANFHEVLPNLTAGMQQRARAMAASLRQQYPMTGAFYSQRLRVVQLTTTPAFGHPSSAEEGKANANQVTIQVTGQLTVRKANVTDSAVTYPVYRLTLVKRGEEWLVDGIEQVKS